MGRQEAFDIFRRDYEHNATIEENKQSLKQRYSEAKSLGQHVNESRQKISKSKSLCDDSVTISTFKCKAGHETREFESCPKNSSLGYQNGLLDTRK